MISWGDEEIVGSEQNLNMGALKMGQCWASHFEGFQGHTQKVDRLELSEY